MTDKSRRIILGIMMLAVLFAFLFNYNQRKEIANCDVAINVFEVNGLDPDKYLKGIDCSKPVRIYEVKRGDVFIQYQLPGAPQGNFYALEGSTPSELGINEIGYDYDEEIVVKKEKRYYIATRDFNVLSSYAAAVVDDWSTPEDETQTEGSKQQFFSTCKKCFRLQ